MANTDLYLSMPADTDGISLVTSSTAWTFGPWVIVDGSLGTDIQIYSIAFHPTNIPTVDVASQFVIEVGKGHPGAETTIIQIPYSIKADTNVGIYQPGAEVVLPEPVFVQSGQTISMRVTGSVASAVTYQGVKIKYQGLKNIAVSPLYSNNYQRFKSGSGTSTSIVGVR